MTGQAPELLLQDPGAYIRAHIRTVPDWPEKGVMFRDITPLLSNPRVFRVLIDQFVHRYFSPRPDAIAGLDARGFIIGSVVAYELNVGFVPIRKKGKLPFTTVEETYELALGAGMRAGKISGAGGGGFMMLLVDPVRRMDVIRALQQLPGRLYNCHFTKYGTQGWKIN